MINEKGEWIVAKGLNCDIELLVNPSQAFKDWQASNPAFIIKPARDLATELDNLKVELKAKGVLT